VLWLLSRDGETFLTRGVFELSLAPFREQYALLSELLSLRCVRRCCIDAGGLGMQLAESAVEDFGAHRVEAVTFTPALKSQLAGRLRVAVEAQHIRIPVDEAIRNDWHSLGRSVSETGHFRLDAAHGAGGHADRFWAAALALQAADDAPGKAEWRSFGSAVYARPGTW
jgi:phage FluMu gp28-like protein